ncbi:hypothetical protein GA0115240_142522 [Streptomyces sp. DvalAA-14]|uniref:hypothetical protein n=1 Tax=unclassified Streptomyces TaxID=2593676 RepID=UPI00081B2830|nr:MULTISPECIES: hypothetical protein [unclassified Streptomyces]SCE19330.1 hypothetical protein GA0115240_142522 [Streptomyces sp. DvalAA-14]
MWIPSVCAYAFEQLIQWRYGAAGALALGFVALGHKARNTTCTVVGLTALAVLLAQ